jgi:hypothetical protein
VLKDLEGHRGDAGVERDDRDASDVAGGRHERHGAHLPVVGQLRRADQQPEVENGQIQEGPGPESK